MILLQSPVPKQTPGSERTIHEKVNHFGSRKDPWLHVGWEPKVGPSPGPPRLSPCRALPCVHQRQATSSSNRGQAPQSLAKVTAALAARADLSYSLPEFRGRFPREFLESLNLSGKGCSLFFGPTGMCVLVVAFWLAFIGPFLLRFSSRGVKPGLVDLQLHCS